MDAGKVACKKNKTNHPSQGTKHAIVETCTRGTYRHAQTAAQPAAVRISYFTSISCNADISDKFNVAPAVTCSVDVFICGREETTISVQQEQKQHRQDHKN